MSCNSLSWLQSHSNTSDVYSWWVSIRPHCLFMQPNDFLRPTYKRNANTPGRRVISIMLSSCWADLHVNRRCASVFEGSGQGVPVCAALLCSLLDCTVIDMQNTLCQAKRLCLCMLPVSRLYPVGHLWRLDSSESQYGRCFPRMYIKCLKTSPGPLRSCTFCRGLSTKYQTSSKSTSWLYCSWRCEIFRHNTCLIKKY